LRNILEVACHWDAVILLDEADIFLEKRTESDIQRNAMVGIFLRLLEYHNGVMFLTTNRVKNFDEAFHSRISIALKYDGLDKFTRTEIWNNLLNSAGLDKNNIDIEYLSNFDINGRQIKNVIRLGETVAKDKGTQITTQDLEMIIKLTSEFTQDVKANNK